MAGFLRKIFPKRADKVQPDAEAPQTEPAGAAGRPAGRQLAITNGQWPTALHPPQLIAGCGISVGMQREHNEDALFTLTTTLVSNTSHTPFGLYIIADGMGGHLHGELASEIAIRAMSSYVIRKLYAPLFSISPESPDEPLQEIMQDGVQLAHRAILRDTPGGGTTLTAALILGDKMTIAHVGDSRAYSIDPDGQIQALTRDHSLVQRLQELGKISPEEANHHPQRNVLYRALGQGDDFDAEIATMKIRPGHLLICSDGLWGVISESLIAELVASTTHPAVTCQQLIEAVNAAGGPDNISAVLVRLPD